MFNDDPWPKELKGKRVLVIHPFANTIRDQYENKRTRLFEGTEILPKFMFITQRQTIAGNKDACFDDWFEALEYMYHDALEQDFDIAIIGYGAYGYPLASEFKMARKQICNLGGVTQVLFVIRCRRFDQDPKDEDIPLNFKKVEDGFYWKS